MTVFCAGLILCLYFGTGFIARCSYNSRINELGGITMKKTSVRSAVAGAAIFAVGLVLVVMTRSGALAEQAAASAQFPFALSLILTLVGAVVALFSLLPERRPTDTRTLTMAALFAALCYVGFAVCKIDVPVGDDKTAFHLGNAFCVLAALFLGGLWGGLSGAVGMTIADLTTGYVTSAPKTFLLKLCIGLITGLIAHKVFHLSRDAERKVSLPVATALSCAAGMAFNVVADPLVGYFYKMYILGQPQQVASALAKMGAVTTFVNAVLAVLSSTVLYLAIRPALKKSNLMPQV